MLIVKSFHNTSKHPTFALKFVLYIIIIVSWFIIKTSSSGMFLVRKRAYNSGCAFFV
nr:MAG TPA: hypothetical protein [Caudoviricetes sp.]